MLLRFGTQSARNVLETSAAQPIWTDRQSVERCPRWTQIWHTGRAQCLLGIFESLATYSLSTTVS